MLTWVPRPNCPAGQWKSQKLRIHFHVCEPQRWRTGLFSSTIMTQHQFHSPFTYFYYYYNYFFNIFPFVYSFMNYFKLENRPHRIMYLPLDFLTHSTMKKVMNFGFNYENNTPLFGCFFTLLLWLMRPSIWDRNWLVNHIHNTRLWLYNNIQVIC